MRQAVLIIAVFASSFALATTKSIYANGILWKCEIDSYNKETWIGHLYPYVKAINQDTSGNITIPSTLGGYPVTRICAESFLNCTNLLSVTIPDGVKYIGSDAFSGCNRLTTVVIPNGVTEIGYNAFDGCSALTTITIPSSVRSIGSRAFKNCSSLTTIKIPDDVTSIEYDTFYGCSNLQSVNLSKNLVEGSVIL